MFMKGEFSNRLLQVSLFSALVYYITAYPIVFEKARKYFPIKFKKTHHLLIFHTFVFAVLMYLLTYFVFDPIVRVVEGNNSALSNVGDTVGIAQCPEGTHRVGGDGKKDDTLYCQDENNNALFTFTCPGEQWMTSEKPNSWFCQEKTDKQREHEKAKQLEQIAQAEELGLEVQALTTSRT